MNVFTEMLEGRTMMSATPLQILQDQATASAALKQVQTAIKAYQAGFKSDFNTLTKDLKATHPTAANNALLKTIQVDQNKGIATMNADLAGITKTGKSLIAKAAADYLKYSAKPTDALKAKLEAELNAVGQAATPAVTKFLTDLQTCVMKLQTDCTALASANPNATKLTGDLQGTVLHGQANAQTIQAATNTAVTDVTTLVHDLTPA